MKIPLLSDLISVLLPPTCYMCGAPLPHGADFICTACEAELPLIDPIPGMTQIEERLASVRTLVHARAWMQYLPRDASADLVRNIKYYGARSLAEYLGRRMARDLTPTGIFTGVTALVPVPLHWRRRLKRGYNQSALLARGISAITGIPVRPDLLQARRHRSQTGLHGTARAANVSGVYRLNPHRAHLLKNALHLPHIMLIDDVCTTGATLRDAAEALTPAPVSVLTLALTEL